MRSWILRTIAALSLAVAPAVTFAPPAQAAAYATTFYSGAAYTGTLRTVDHLACDGRVTVLPGRFQSFANRPAPGCRVQVYNNASPDWLTLCIGRSTLPRLHQSSPEVRSVPGSSPVCVAGPW